MSNNEPSAIVLHGIACIGGLYIRFDSNGENGSFKVAAIHPFWIAKEVSNWLGIARSEPGLRDRKVSQIACSSARGADVSCKTPWASAK
jgi:hypothetical protein